MAAQGFKSNHWTTTDGVPEGGCSFGTGFTISWQRGPLGRGAERKEPNGAFVEDVIQAVIDRIEYYQSSKFNSAFNAQALDHLRCAVDALQARTAQREERKVEGTSSV